MIWAWVGELLAGFTLALFLRLFVINVARIQGSSMLPALQDREWALVWRLPYRFRRPRRGDVVICHYPGRRMKRIKWLPQAFVKRVIGLPGDAVEIVEGIVYINGEPLEEPFLDPARCRSTRSRPVQQLTEDEYFVMGDNRDRSNDSRNVGPLRRRDIRGRVICILWPVKHIRRVR